METILYLTAGLIISVISLGLILKVVMMVIDILSKPTYIGLIYFETIHDSEKLKINKPPKNGVLKLIMNLSASFITLTIINCIIHFANLQLSEDTFMDYLSTGKIISLGSSILIIACLVVIYSINFFSEKITEDSFTKIDALDLKPFLKFWK
ncbi:hypothetical protein [Sinomicrobium oceani]|uniref:hypothetical protein n=1 Tax=Sinomicrobium oceani TaxID=1150368 RepID=UPI00227B3CB0|nr:hypothetical protein [Sinomicrobium oceani]